jgi:alpha-L-rhamnosidase
MKRTTFVFCLLGLFLFVHCAKRKSDADRLFVPERLRCEFLKDPLGIDTPNPRLSWSFRPAVRSQIQTAFRVLVAGSLESLQTDRGDWWDSGKVPSDRSVDVRYAGRKLASGASCWWKVKVWNKDNQESNWSESAFFSMGLLSDSDWKAVWIGLDKPASQDDIQSWLTRLSARMLRKTFEIPKKLKRATVYYSGLGLSELHLNGKKVGDAVLSPGLTEYSKRVFYVTYEVTSLLKEGGNAVGAVLGNGRYFPPRRDEHVQAIHFPKLMFQLHLEYEDGSAENVVSDETWKLTTDGPILANNEYDGEMVDARKEIPGWDLPNFDDSKWATAQKVEPPSGKLVAQMIRPIKITQTLESVQISRPKPNVSIFDMGQNLVGWVRLKIKGAKSGAAIRLRFAETLQKGGNLYTANLRSAKAEDVYITKGDSVEVYEPRFTTHGFRFVELTGYPGTPDSGTIVGRVIHDDIEPSGTFDCSNSMINRIYQNAVWGVRGNYRSIPTDCPQRDERQGWLGDRAVASKGESYLFDIHALYAKWLDDIEDAQSDSGSIPDVAPTFWKRYTDNTTWPGAYLLIANMLLTQYGDSGVVRRHYPSMKKWMQYMAKYMKNGLMTKDTYGDWCVPPETLNLIFSRDPKRITPGDCIGTAYFYYEARLMQKFAGMLDLPDDVRAFGDLADGLKKALNEKLFDKTLVRYANNSATSNLLPLAFGMAPESGRQKIFGNIVEKIMGDADGHMVVGLVGAQWIMRTLTQFGRPDVAYLLAGNSTYPSWGYMVESGATTVWELWNGNTAEPSMNSQNHVMLIGDLLIWLYENLAGIQPDPEKPGFRHILMKPVPVGDLAYVRASHRSPYGLIESSWKIQNGQFLWNITVPPNSEATVYVPAPEEKLVKESGRPAKKAKGVRFLRIEDGRIVYAVKSGSYAFSVQNYKPIIAIKPVVSTPVILPADTSAAYPSDIQVQIRCRTEGAQIRYTLDGTEPTERSPLYEAPFQTDGTVTVTAKAFKQGATPSYSRITSIDVYRTEINGLNYVYYEGEWTALPDFKKLRPRKTGSAIGFDVGKIKMRRDYFGIVYRGMIRIPSDGEYVFFLGSDDGSRLVIDDSTVVVNDFVHSMTEKTGAIGLTKGKHRIEVEFFEATGDEGLSAGIQGPSLPRQAVPTSFLFKR